MEAEDVDFEPALVRFGGPVLDHVEVAVVNVEVSAIEIKHRPAVHDLSPVKRSIDVSVPAELFEGRDVDAASIVDGEVPVAVRTVVAASARAAKVHRNHVRNLPARRDHGRYELVVGHAGSSDWIATCGSSPPTSSNFWRKY